MAQIISGYIKAETLKTMLETLEKKNLKGIGVTISVNDETFGEYGQNVNMYVSQTKEEQTEKKRKFYILNGKTVWSNKGEFVAPKEQKSTESHAPITDQEDPF